MSRNLAGSRIGRSMGAPLNGRIRRLLRYATFGFGLWLIMAEDGPVPSMEALWHFARFGHAVG
jgi:hypothetical protein